MRSSNICNGITITELETLILYYFQLKFHLYFEELGTEDILKSRFSCSPNRIKNITRNHYYSTKINIFLSFTALVHLFRTLRSSTVTLVKRDHKSNEYQMSILRAGPVCFNYQQLTDYSLITTHIYNVDHRHLEQGFTASGRPVP